MDIDIAVETFVACMVGNKAARTIDSYHSRLSMSPHNFVSFLKSAPRGIRIAEDLTEEILLDYVEYLAHNVTANHAQGYVSVVRQFIFFCRTQNWTQLSGAVKLPQRTKKTLPVVDPQLRDAVLQGSWGYNKFTRSRNNLIIALIAVVGLDPFEIVKIKMGDIVPAGNTGLLTVYGRRGKVKSILLDTIVWTRMLDYVKQRGDLLAFRKAESDSLLIGSLPNRIESIKCGAINVLFKSIKSQLTKSGYMGSVKDLTAMALKKTVMPIKPNGSSLGSSMYKEVFILERREQTSVQGTLLIQSDIVAIVSSEKKLEETMLAARKPCNYWWCVTPRTVDGQILSNPPSKFYSADGQLLLDQPFYFPNFRNLRCVREVVVQ